ncbi:unnamed protein product [Didymodactylos carnosus]|uniref:Gamma-interferon-inducible lysosomal thiol reductase n=1 Tax=Didymodactylos carnosus TaxID=1234261 RepID=A0A814W5Y5_9BILA|nr:unnamed protein product [Didymodactylos carnosus]CAF3961403.1 unnamed protein product [Didymodactylos carnosus]
MRLILIAWCIMVFCIDLAITADTICPRVWPAYQALSSIVNITFIPYGNAKELFRPETGLWQFYCQHGSDECLGNIIHPFIYCTESNRGDVEQIAKECALKSSIDYDKISTCTKSKLGNDLQHQYALMTDALQPQHTFVPWVTLNNEHTAKIQEQAEDNLIGLLCDTYKGSNIPDACKKSN